MKLTHLSFQNVTGVRTPHVPTNTERMQAYRACMPVQFGNAVFTDRHAGERIYAPALAGEDRGCAEAGGRE